MEDKVEKLRHRLKFWWFWLGFCTLISITLNLWHSLTIKPNPVLIAEACRVSAALCDEAREVAVQVAGIHPILGIIFAVVPPTLAAALSDGLVDPTVGRWIKRAIMLLFFLAMATSIVSQAMVMHPYGGGYYAEWSIPTSLDATALISLHMIIKIKGLIRELSDAADVEADTARLRADIEADIRPDIEADIRRTYEADIARAVADREADMGRTLGADMERTLAAERADMEADKDRTLAALEAELQESFEDRVAALVDTLRPQLELEIAARIRRESAPEKKPRGGSTSVGTAPISKGNKAESSKNDLLMLMRCEPGLTEKQQATSLGVSDRTIRRWKDQLEKEGAVGADMSAPVVPLRVAR